MMVTPKDAQVYLLEAGQSEQIPDLGRAALMLAVMDRDQVDLAPYEDHIAELANNVRRGIRNASDLLTKLMTMRMIVAREAGYEGDRLSYEDVENADLISVIDRRKGLPVTLSILYMTIGRRLGWTVCGLNFPSHFLIRFSDVEDHIVVDPFHNGAVMEAAGMRLLLKKLLGDKAELQPDFYQPVTDRDILIRLLNNISTRALNDGEPDRALEVMQRIQLFAPRYLENLRDIGLVEIQRGNPGAAASYLQEYLEKAENAEDRYHVSTVLERLRKQIH